MCWPGWSVFLDTKIITFSRRHIFFFFSSQTLKISQTTSLDERKRLHQFSSFGDDLVARTRRSKLLAWLAWLAKRYIGGSPI